MRMHLLFPETRIIGLHLCRCMYGSIFIQIFAVGSKRYIFFAPECVLAFQGCSGSSKVDDFGTSSRKRIYDFLLIRHCDYGPILHRFWDTATYWLKIPYFCYPSLIRRPRSRLPMFPLEFCGEVNHEETSHGAILEWRPHDRSLSHNDTVPACDRRTDRQTDGRIYYS